MITQLDDDDLDEPVEEDKGNPSMVYEETLEDGSKSWDPLGLRTPAEEDAADRAVENLAQMKKQKEINEED